MSSDDINQFKKDVDRTFTNDKHTKENAKKILNDFFENSTVTYLLTD